ncbi:MAG TPA: sulfatase-like hydrolase/transferase [Chthoniobacteraceae bacterium]|jgi:arylsulfatase A-like enzyme|nr:sulfatase-like hydrolase/transferase [Chthoniobacteraceae bacterium]
MLRALVLSLLFTASALAADRPPNIVFIFADDLGIDDLSCYGRKDQPTPVLDHLAGEGMRFSTAYCAQPICSASRAALLTGKSPARLHITTFLPGRPDKPSQKLLHPLINQQLALEETTLAEALKPAGYVSACIGKWHLGGVGFGPAQQGFDVVFAGHANTAPTEEEGGKGEYELTAHGLEFIEANRDKPFYLYLAHNSPHIPLAAQMKRIENHPDAFNPLYAAVIETLDDSIGRVLRKLDELHLREQTIVIFASDNGGLHVAEGGLTAPSTHNGAFRAGKGYLYEGGLREPLIVRWPGHVPPGVVNPTPVSLADLMPTLVELAGAPKREGLDFQSIAGLLQGKEGTRPTEFYWHFPHYTNQGSRPAGAVRLENWKLIENYEDGSAELYDLATDAGEQTNLAAREPARVAEMRGKLAAWRIAVNAQEMTANPAFDLAWYNEIYPVLDTTNIKTAPTGAAMAPLFQAWRKAMDRPAPKTLPVVAGAPGFLILHARDAVVAGSALRYEPQPPKNTLGFWKNVEDTASWTIDLPAGGKYAVEALVGCGTGSGGAQVEIGAGGEVLTFQVPETGHFQNFVPKAIGTLKLPAGRSTVKVTPKTKPGAAVMDLRQLTLTRLPD